MFSERIFKKERILGMLGKTNENIRNMLTKSEKIKETYKLSPIKETMILLVLNTCLPTFDVFSDLFLIVKLYNNENPIWARLLLVPFLANYLLTWMAWWRLDKQKKVSFIAPTLACYPQYSAIKVIHFIWTDTEKGLKKKRQLEREMSEMEVFAESVITTLVMTDITAQTWYRNSIESIDQSIDQFTHIETFNEVNFKLIIGEPGTFDYYMYFIGYLTSIISASLGLAKCLTTGPCRTLCEVGSIGGLCIGRVFLLYTSVGGTFVGKALLFGIVHMLPVYEETLYDVPIYGDSTNDLLILAFLFIPGLLVSLVSLCHYNCITIILSHPSLLLMPVFTHYTFSVNNKCCYNKGEEAMITFSRNWSLANIVMSALGIVPVIMIKFDFLFPFTIPFIVGIFLTVMHLFLDSCCCVCSTSNDLQYAVLKTSDPLREYVVDKDSGRVIRMEALIN